MSPQKPIKVFVSLVTPFLYGMERSVIEKFEALQPEVEAHFLLTYTTFRLDLPILHAVKEAGIAYSFLSDKKDWPTLRKPRSVREGLAILKAIILGNIDTLKASRGHDIFYFPSLRTPYSAFLTIVLYKLTRRPVIYGFHDTLNRRSRLLRCLGPLISHYVFHSEYTRAAFLLNNPWASNRDLPVFSNIVRFLPTAAPSPLPSDSRGILFVGQIAKYKGADLLIEAFLQIRDRYKDVSLHFVGEPHEDYKEEFFASIRTPESEGRIVHWGYRDDVHNFLKGAYVFVQPSRPSLFQESFGRGVIEAAAAGVPSICFRSGALPEHVISGYSGLICDEESVDCLSRNLSMVLSNPELRNTYGINARRRFEDYYSTDVLKGKWLDLFETMVGRQ